MRVIAGKYRSRIIRMPKGAKIRPTKDRVREALFGIIGEFVCESTVLDAFAGSGAFGIEALSRGAKRVVFIENDKRCIETIKNNLKTLGIKIKEDAASIMKMDVSRALDILERRKERFDLVLLDPPYYKGLAKKTLIKITHRDILKPYCIIIAEHHKSDSLLEELDNLTSYRTVCYGDVCLTFYKEK